MVPGIIGPVIDNFSESFMTGQQSPIDITTIIMLETESKVNRGAIFPTFVDGKAKIQNPFDLGTIPASSFDVRVNASSSILPEQDTNKQTNIQ